MASQQPDVVAATAMPSPSGAVGEFTYLADSEGYVVIRNGERVASSSMPATVATNTQRALQWISNEQSSGPRP